MKQWAKSEPVFWRDERVPYLECRYIEDGDTVCYAPHSHVEWSMGVIVSGASHFSYGEKTFPVTADTLVFINPDKIHACNPRAGAESPWSYVMFYVSPVWLATLRYELGLLAEPHWQDMTVDHCVSPRLADDAQLLMGGLVDEAISLAEKEAAIRDYFSRVMLMAATAPSSLGEPGPEPPQPLLMLARYLDSHCIDAVSVAQMSDRTGYSASHLVRAFRRYFGLTPHAYQLNRRIQLGRKALQQGGAIVDVAHQVGFADQPHFQRAFKKRVAATPGQYARSPQTE